MHVFFEMDFKKFCGSLEAAVLMQALISASSDGWTVRGKTKKDLEDLCGLNSKEQSKGLDVLIKEKLIALELEGSPAKRIYKINKPRYQFIMKSFRQDFKKMAGNDF